MGLLKKISFQISDSKHYEVIINTFSLLFLLNFLTYSFYAVLSKNNNFILELLIHLNFIIFFYYSKQNKYFFKVSFKKSDLIIFLVCILFICIILNDHLLIPLWADEIAPTLRSLRTAYFASFYLNNNLQIEFLKDLPLKYVIQFINFLIISLTVFIFYFSNKFKNTRTLIFIIFLSLFLRFLLKDGTIHPPINHIFSTLFATFISIDHLIIRISYLCIFSIFLVSIFKLTSSTINIWISFSFLLSIASLPILCLASVTPDHSIWSFIVFTYILMKIHIDEKINYSFLILIISLGILCRVSIFSIFSLLLLTFLLDKFKNKENFFRDIKFILFKEKSIFTLLICIPLILGSLIFGTPVYEGVEDHNVIYNLIDNSKIIFNSTIKQIPYLYLIFPFFILFSKRRIEIITFFLFNVFIYSSISKEAFGGAKYVIEYAIPFFILGQFILIRFLQSRNKIKLTILINFLLIIINIYDLKTFSKNNYNGEKIAKKYSEIIKDNDKKSKYILKIPYKYDDAFAVLENRNKLSNYYIFGTHYGYLLDIIEGINYSELSSIKLVREEVSKLNENDDLNLLVNGINKIPQLEYLLIANISYKEELIKVLKNNYWKIDQVFYEKNYKTKLYLLKKIK